MQSVIVALPSFLVVLLHAALINLSCVTKFTISAEQHGVMIAVASAANCVNS